MSSAPLHQEAAVAPLNAYRCEIRCATILRKRMALANATEANTEERAATRRTRQGENEPTVTATIVSREPDAAHGDGLAALGDALVLQMFDSGLGETLRMAYTMLQNHQEREGRRAARSAAADALREHLAQLDDGTDV